MLFVFENTGILYMSIYTYTHYEWMIVTCILPSCVTSCMCVVYANYKIVCIPCSQVVMAILHGWEMVGYFRG